MAEWWQWVSVVFLVLGLLLYVNRKFLLKWWLLSGELSRGKLTAQQFLIKFMMPDEEDYKKESTESKIIDIENKK